MKLFSLSSNCYCCLMETWTILLFIDSFKLFLQRLYSLAWMNTEIYILLSPQSASDLTENSLNANLKKKKKKGILYLNILN